MKKIVIILVFLIILALPTIVPLFHSGFFQSDDGEWMVIRFSAFHESLRDGQVPVRFLQRLNHGYGYPVANFLYPGFMYLAEPIHLIGFGFVESVKIIFGLSLVGSALFCYLWLVKIFQRLPAFVGSLIYLYAPYHLFDVYKRGSIGEVLALAVIPFILWQIERKSLFWTSMGIAMLILSHNTLALLFLPIIVLYRFFRYRPTIRYTPSLTWLARLTVPLYAIFFGLGISAFFWIPALFDLRYTKFFQTRVSEWSQYFVSYDLIGFSTIFIFLTAGFLLIQKFQRQRDVFALSFFAGGLISIFFATELSYAFWQILPVSLIQFPFRFLSVTILCTAFLTAFVLSQVQKSILFAGVACVVLLTVFSFNTFMTLPEYFDKGDTFYSTNQATTTVQNEYMPIWVKQQPIERFRNKVEIIEGQSTIENVSFNAKTTSFNVVAQTNSKARINTVFFPGWQASIDEKNTNISHDNKEGVIEITIPKGEHLVKTSFTETQVRLASDVFSIVSLLVLCVWKVKISTKV